MGIRYYNLFNLLNRRGMNISELRKIISSATVAKLKKGEYISGEAIEKICTFLKCQPGDIMEVYKTITYTDSNGEEQTKEVRVDQEEIDMLTELLKQNPMFGKVMDMYKESAKTPAEKRAVEEAENFFKEEGFKKNQE